MTSARFLSLVCPLLLAGNMALAQQSASQPGASGAGPIHESMSGGMQNMMGMQSTGDVDRDFVTMMKAHHEMAIQMSEAELANGKSPEIKAMARQIIKDSRRDIAKFDKWMQQRK